MDGVLLVDGHPIVRDALRGLLEPMGATVLTAGSPEEGERLARVHRPSLVVTDLAFPGAPLGGLALIRRLLRERDPAPRVLVFSRCDAPGLAPLALRAGALGYVSKAAGLAEFARAYRRVRAGKGYLTADLALALAAPARSADPLDGLTGRQLRILRLMAEGRSQRQAAEALLVSAKTVSNEVALIRERVRAGDRSGLVRFALRHREAVAIRLAADPC
ncbi:response regulator transcription factor [Methylobacterium sp. WSM2598]|uniref:response regulator transcription factor n=1 Tax=Methylobacterium sp. WSM2598 TaxID=398261 RepID=UPI00035D4DEA|nr:response regulator transcription factor [Methylobacterium sp. WSM2598]